MKGEQKSRLAFHKHVRVFHEQKCKGEGSKELLRGFGAEEVVKVCDPNCSLMTSSKSMLEELDAILAEQRLVSPEEEKSKSACKAAYSKSGILASLARTTTS